MNLYPGPIPLPIGQPGAQGPLGPHGPIGQYVGNFLHARRIVVKSEFFFYRDNKATLETQEKKEIRVLQ